MSSDTGFVFICLRVPVILTGCFYLFKHSANQVMYFRFSKSHRMFILTGNMQISEDNFQNEVIKLGHVSQSRTVVIPENLK